MNVTLRLARSDDIPRLFRWRNDPLTRAMSRSPEEIDYATHTAWVARALAYEDVALFIGDSARDGQWVSVGTTRLDLHPSPGAAEVSITVAPAWRGRGIATSLLAATLQYGRERLGVTRFEAVIHWNNVRSHRLFARAGFTCTRMLEPDWMHWDG